MDTIKHKRVAISAEAHSHRQSYSGHVPHTKAQTGNAASSERQEAEAEGRGQTEIQRNAKGSRPSDARLKKRTHFAQHFADVDDAVAEVVVPAQPIVEFNPIQISFMRVIEGRDSTKAGQEGVQRQPQSSAGGTPVERTRHANQSATTRHKTGRSSRLTRPSL
jgi:hypothetical protein